MMELDQKVEQFLEKRALPSPPLLLALSGGPDSLALFFCLLAIRERRGLTFEVAHVDHQWRQESSQEALSLKELAKVHQVPFHLKKLNPLEMRGNLEAVCREERYLFFASLFSQKAFQALLTGHHDDDVAETVLKRILEGSHFSAWSSLREKSLMKGMVILRPLIGSDKREIETFLAKRTIIPFYDRTNEECRFLRPRMRKEILPLLAASFGKEIKKNLIYAASQAEEMEEYFHKKWSPHLKTIQKGPFGSWLSLSGHDFEESLEAKYLVRLFCKGEGLSPSREIVKKAAAALLEGKANLRFEIGQKELIVDRKELFLVPPPLPNTPLSLKIEMEGTFQLDRWEIQVKQVPEGSRSEANWKKGWSGKCEKIIPYSPEGYWIGFPNEKEIANFPAVRRLWNEGRVPAFLRSFFPLIWKEGIICQDFLLPQKKLEGQQKLLVSLKLCSS